LDFRQQPLLVGGAAVESDQDIPGQRVGLNALDPLHSVHQGFDLAHIVCRPAWQVEAYSSGDQAQDPKFVRRCHHDPPFL
jgi:hypothetical protein